MPQITIGIIDPFEPAIVDVIRNALPFDWSLSIARGRSLADHAEALKTADIAFVMATPVADGLIRSSARLGFIQKMGAGTDKIDLATCEELGIAVARLYAGNAIPVAEHTIMLILASYRRLPILDRSTRAGEWNKEGCRGINRHLHGKTVGIVGFGAIGRAVAKILLGFGVTVQYFDPQRAPEAVEKSLNASYQPLEMLLKTSDVVTLHLPLTRETREVIGRKQIAMMKEGALLVNCARGGLVDEAALLDALSNGKLFGAALDAFTTEPPKNNPLLTLTNTIVTPHAAGATIDNFAALARRAVSNARHFLGGQDLPVDDCILKADPARRPSTDQAAVNHA